MEQFKIVEKKNTLAVHGLFYTLDRAERHLTKVIPEYVAKGYFRDKTLTANDFMIVDWRGNNMSQLNEDKHTHTPWEIPHQNGKDIYSKNGAIVGTIYHLPDAAFIVRAVNSHDRLLSDLKDAYAFISAQSAYNSPLCINMRATIAKAEGK